MQYNTYRQRPLEDWITSRKDLNIGDYIAFYDHTKGKEVVAKYEGYPVPGKESLICFTPIEGGTSDMICFYETVVYRVRDVEIRDRVECSCGAKYTSRPTYHLSYCKFGG